MTDPLPLVKKLSLYGHVKNRPEEKVTSSYTWPEGITTSEAMAKVWAFQRAFKFIKSETEHFDVPVRKTFYISCLVEKNNHQVISITQHRVWAVSEEEAISLAKKWCLELKPGFNIGEVIGMEHEG